MDKVLSIIIPSYNMEKYLPKCLGSLVVDDAELLEKLDVIVVNDGSKDRTSEIAHEFEAKHPGVFRVIDKPNGHYGSCINAALPAAKGVYVKVLDADDSFDTLTFEKFIRFADVARNQDGSIVDLLISAFDIVDENGAVTERRNFNLPPDKTFGIDELVNLKNELLMHGIAYRTERVRESGYRQTEGCIYTDTEWMCEPMLTVRRCRYFALPVYQYLVGREGQSVSVNSFIKNVHIQLSIMDRIVSLYQKRSATMTPDQKRYIEIQVTRLYRLTVDGYVLGVSSRRLNKEFVPVDEMVKAVLPKARVEGGRGYTIFSGGRHPFHYVTAWQNASRATRWMVPIFVRTYMYLRRCSKRIVK